MRRMLSYDRMLLLLLCTPGILHFIVFKYTPLLGNVIAFQEYNLFQGLRNSPWVGLQHFQNMLDYPEFARIMGNTLLLSLYSIVFGFPAPLFLALLLNEMRSLLLKRTTQTLLYLPHFLSWIIVGGIVINFLSIDGSINQIVSWFGVQPQDWLIHSEYFRSILVSVGIWKEVGWGMIIYFAALTGINPHLYEAAMVDGAGRWRRMWSITIPSLMPAIVVLFLLRVGVVLDSNVEQVLVLLNPFVRDTGEVIDTYVYRIGLLGSQYSFTTAIGLFKSVIGLAMVMMLNQISKKATGESIY